MNTLNTAYNNLVNQTNLSEILPNVPFSELAKRDIKNILNNQNLNLTSAQVNGLECMKRLINERQCQTVNDLSMAKPTFVYCLFLIAKLVVESVSLLLACSLVYYSFSSRNLEERIIRLLGICFYAYFPSFTISTLEQIYWPKLSLSAK